MISELCSVIIPVYNCEKYIKQTIISVLDQTYSNLEIIVVDDCSDDLTPQILQELKKADGRIKVLRNSVNRGVAFSRTLGVNHSEGDLVAYLDADDLWAVDKIEKQVQLINECGADFVYSAYDFIDESNNKLDLVFNVKDKAVFKDILKQNFIAPSTVLIRKYIADAFPMYREGFSDTKLLEDHINWMSILKSGITAYGVNEPLMHYRIVKGSRSSSKFKLIKKQYKSFRFVGLNIFKSWFYTIVVSIKAVKKYKKHFLRR